MILKLEKLFADWAAAPHPSKMLNDSCKGQLKLKVNISIIILPPNQATNRIVFSDIQQFFRDIIPVTHSAMDQGDFYHRGLKSEPTQTAGLAVLCAAASLVITLGKYVVRGM